MKKVGILLLSTLVSVSMIEAKPAKKATLATANDSVSYSIGIEFARSVKENMNNLPGKPFSDALVLEAFNKVFNGDTLDLLIKQDKTGEIIQNYMRKAQELAAEKAKAEGKLFLQSNLKNNPKVKQTNSGLQYEVITEGKGIKPSAADKVKVHYHGTLIDGTVFDSSVDRGEPAVFELNKVIPGWTEGLQLMSIGSKYKFYIPSELGYGARSAGSIPPYSVLIFEVELLDVAKAQAQAPSNNGGPKYQFPAYQRTDR